MSLMIAHEIERHHIQCDIKLNIQAGVKWKPCHASQRMLQSFVLVPLGFRICITFAYELKRSLQSLLFDV